MERQLNPTGEDFARLWALNPLAAERLKNIVLDRLLAEAEARLTEIASIKALIDGAADGSEMAVKPD